MRENAYGNYVFLPLVLEQPSSARFLVGYHRLASSVNADECGCFHFPFLPIRSPCPISIILMPDRLLDVWKLIYARQKMLFEREPEEKRLVRRCYAWCLFWRWIASNWYILKQIAKYVRSPYWRRIDTDQIFQLRIVMCILSPYSIYELKIILQ